MESQRGSGGVREADEPVRAPENAPAVLLNANAKLVRRSTRRALERILPPGHVFWSETLEQTEAFAADILERGFTRLFIGGGDGTFAHTVTRMERAAAQIEARTGLSVRWPALGILRLGTGNALGYLAGAGSPTADIALHVEAHPPSVARVPLIRDVASGLLFPFASLGYDAGALNDYATATGSWKHPWARLVGRSLAGYAWSLGTRTLPREFGRAPTHLRVEAIGRAGAVDTSDQEVSLPADSVLFEGPARAVVAGTSPYYGYGIRALPFAQRRADRMQVRISSASAVFLLGHLPQLWSGRLRSDDIRDFLVEGVRVRTDAPIPIQWAGEAGGRRDHLEWRLSGLEIELLGGSRLPRAPS